MESIHYLKARNSDFLAGTDLEIFELEGKSKTLTIKNVEYKENFKVNGRTKPKGVVVYFEEPYAKPLILNTTNSTIIKEQTGIIDAKKWKGFSIEFYFNTNVEMKISKTEVRKGGIRVKSVNTNGLVPDVKDFETRIKETTNRAELISIWQEMNEEEQVQYQVAVTEKSKTFK